MRKLRVSLSGALAAVTTAAVLALGQPAQAAPPRHDGATATATATATAAAAPVAGSFVPVTPFRAGDSRRSGGPIAARHGLKVLIGGHGGVPARNVSAVAVTLTAVAPSASGGLIAYAFGGTRPAVRNLTYRSGTSITVSTVSRVSSTGVLDVYNDAGAGHTNIVVDVSGYYVGGAASNTQPGIFHALPVPKRVVDTRGGRGAMPAGTSRDAGIGGFGGVPRSGVGSLVVAITAMSPTASGAITAYSVGNDRPGPPTASYVSGQDSTSFAIVPTTDSGAITIANVAGRGSVQVAVDVFGWTNAGPAAVAGATQTRYPNRVLNGASIAAGRTGTIQVAGRGGVPLRNVSAALVRLAVGGPQHTGGLIAWAGGRMPGTTVLQFPYRGSAANLVIVPLSSAGSFAYHNNSAGSLAMSVDIVGYVPSTTVTAPTPTSSSRYIHTSAELNGRFADSTTGGEGCTDATVGSSLVLLDFGAQANDKSGVVLTGAGQDKVSYASLVNAVDGYLTSFASCSPPANAIIALGTNNEGDFSTYSAGDRGADWATKVLEAVTMPPSSSIRLMGANDIEPLFASTEPQAAQWETAYLTNTTRDLVFNGSADQCPTAFAMPDQACGNYGWTELGIYHLMTSSVPNKTVHALPQSYNPGMAAQWANIDQTGIEHGGAPIDFIGALTEQAVCTPPVQGCSVPNYGPTDGWTALYRAISTVVAAPSIPAVTDLRADS